MIRFGNVILPHGLALAPLAGVSDRAFRRVCRACGADFSVSEMVSAKALCYEQKAKKAVRSVTGLLASVHADETPMAVQIFGHEPEFMAEAARLITANEYIGCVSEVPPSAIDINMGCPVKKVTGNGEGSALLKDPRLAGEIVEAVVKATHLPVTVKIRAGWDKDSINAVEMAQIIEAAGASMICVHGRTREQMYEPGVDRGIISAVKAAVRIPVMGNGDIYTAADALSMMQETGCDGVMIARGAMGNPWIFAEIRAALSGEAYVYPSAAERFETALVQVREMISEKGERVGVAEAKKHLAWYCRGIDGAAAARSRIMQAEGYQELESIIRGLM
ncbi:MAG: tRNA dihydrouridine synthase DusB [Ruminococcaceae bacterium]|nr:tRNA dihydrouridine synthase DusB [Oscillospiraceae bacterium]